MGSIIGGAIQAGATMDAANVEAQAAEQAAELQQEDTGAAIEAAQTGYNYLTSGAGSGAMANYINEGQTALGNEQTSQNMIAQLLGEAPTSATANWNTSNPAMAPVNLPGNAGMASYNSASPNASYVGPVTNGPITTSGGLKVASAGTAPNYTPPTTTASPYTAPAGAAPNTTAASPYAAPTGGAPSYVAGGNYAAPGGTSGGTTSFSGTSPTSLSFTGTTIPSTLPGATMPTLNSNATSGSEQNPIQIGVGTNIVQPGQWTINANGNESFVPPAGATTVNQPTGRTGSSLSYNPNALVWPAGANTPNQTPPVQQQAAPPPVQQQQAAAPAGNANNAFQNYLNSTAYQFQLGQGSGAIMANAGSTGLLDSGANAKALEQYGQNLAGTTFNNYLGQLGGLEAQQANTAGAGQTALGTIGSTGTASGTAAAGSIMTGAANQGNLMMQGANAQGNAIAGLGGSLGNMFSQFGGVGQNTSMFGGFGNIFGGGGSSGGGGDSGLSSFGGAF